MKSQTIKIYIFSGFTALTMVVLTSCGKKSQARQEASGSQDNGITAGVSGCTTDATAIRTTTAGSSSNGDSSSSGSAGSGSESPKPPSPYLVQSTSNITFQKKIKKLIENSCLECHSKDSKLQKPLLDTYDQIRNAAVSALQRMEANTMPPPAGTDKPNETELNDFRVWISEGFLYGPDNERKTTTNSSSAYNNEIRDFLKDKCISCHKADGSQAPNLTTYDSARVSGSRIFTRVKAGTMPPKTDLNSEWVDLVSRWRASGYSLNNDSGSSSTSSGGDSQSSGSSASDCTTD